MGGWGLGPLGREKLVAAWVREGGCRVPAAPRAGHRLAFSRTLQLKGRQIWNKRL